MAFIPGPGMAQVTMLFSQGDGELAQNVFGVDYGTGADIPSSDLVSLNAAFRDWFADGSGTNSYKQLMQSSSQLVSVSSRDLGGAAAAVEVTNCNISGTDGGEKLPQGLTFTLTARTGLAGRSFRGRTYLVGLTANFVDSGQFDVAAAGHVSMAVDAFEALIPAVGEATGSPVLSVLSRVTDVPAPGTPRDSLLSTPITSYGNHDLFMDYQRRRAPGHNRHR